MLLRKEENIIGYTSAVPLSSIDEDFSSMTIPRGTKIYISQKKALTIGNKKITDDAIFDNTAYHGNRDYPSEQSKKYVGIMMKKLEQELKDAGYLYLARNALIKKWLC